MDSFSFECVRIVFGCGSLERLSDEVKMLKGRRVAVVTDRALRETGEKVCEILNRSGLNCELWSGVTAEPEIDVVKEFVSQFDFDTVVGVGGGSTLDVAKLAAVTGKDGDPERLVGRDVSGRKAKLILVPTTAGTGSEVTKLAVFKIPGREVKYVFDSPSLYADVAIVDPVLTVSAPPEVTASSGIDAICHAIEAYTSRYASPISDVLAEKAIKTGSNALREAFANGDNLKARTGMSYAALLAGIAFNNAGTGLGHALGYAHSHIHNLPHGASVGVTMPYVLQYNAISDLKKHARIARLLGSNVRHTRDAAFQAGLEFANLLRDLNMPLKLSDLGAGEEDVSDIVERIFLSEKHVSRNPRTVRKEDMFELVRKAVYGLLSAENN
ncbi:iron-containing alcohol dehydrogenase [Archaeoglobus neptunius]|uniref:iron-containing alcohol dehydrogenase n=1 Tax=Archaeoglobus neptunius TaxID=2798580 RepID=UPI001925EC7E|nr:iron-containing alcohol dehydrogenase [Archaeoglobus neptunius]